MIHIDLKTALTPEAIAEAMPNMVKCSYAAPCIIGACIPADLRVGLDEDDGTSLPVDLLIGQARLSFATPEQAVLAELIQDAFDCGTRERLDALIAEALS